MLKRLFVLFLVLPLASQLFAQGFNSKGGSHRGHNTPYTAQQQQVASWSGSGIAIGERHVATNHHVVDGATNLCIYFPDKDVQYDVKVVATDSKNDLAIVEITDTDFKGFTIDYGYKKSTESIGVGVFVLGFPLVQSMGTEIKLTTGVVSSKSGYQGDASQYQISAPVQPGNSGGPLFNDNGELIGIISAKHTEAENVSYGVKLSYLSDLAEGISGVNLSKQTKLQGKSLSEKCEANIPCTMMFVANNAPKDNSPKSGQSGSNGGGSSVYRSESASGYPIRVNRPEVGKYSSSNVSVYGLELAQNYTAIFVVLRNNNSSDTYYNISEGTYIVDKNTGKRYSLIRTENCPMAPQYKTVRPGEIADIILYFQPLPSNASSIDLYESADGWRFENIKISK